MENIENLLKSKMQTVINNNRTTSNPNISHPLSNTRKPCNYLEFLEMLQKATESTIQNVKFCPDDERNIFLEPDRQLDKSYITHKVKRRTKTKEEKPIFKFEVEEFQTEGRKRIGTCYGWRFDYLIQFDIFCSSYRLAEETMATFEEEIMTKMVGAFKEGGVIEIIFEEQLEDESLNAFRDWCSIRTLRYKITIEKHFMDFEGVIDSITINQNHLRG